ncbi:MAG: hypothetical protein RLZZ292_3153, partial [Bacteroidota bacterium]
VLAFGAILAPFLIYIPINPDTLPKVWEKDGERVSRDTLVQKSCPARQHTVRWDDFSQHHYELTFAICKSDAQKSAQNRNNAGWFPDGHYDYQRLIDHDRALLNDIQAQLDTIATRKQLNSLQKLEMVLTFVQHIEYAMVHPETCAELRQKAQSHWLKADFSDQWHLGTASYTPKNGRTVNPCEENIQQYGVLSPVEFLYRLQGDCDSRTVFLYTLLRSMRYDVIILNSDVLHHSLLGVALDGISYNNGVLYQKNAFSPRYTICETTTSIAMGVFPNFNARDWVEVGTF